MTLKISKNVGLTDIVSTNGTNPLTTQHNVDGEIKEVKVWLFNDDNTKYYTSVNVDPIDTATTDESTWIQLAPDNAGVAGTYLAAGAALSFADGTFGTAGTANITGHAFWVKVTSPSGQIVQNKTDLKLQINSNEFAV